MKYLKGDAARAIIRAYGYESEAPCVDARGLRRDLAHAGARGAHDLVLLVLATPLAWWLARTRSRWRAPVVGRRRIAARAAADGARLLPAGRVRAARARGRRYAGLSGSGRCPSVSGAWSSARWSIRCPSPCSRCSNAFEAMGARPLEAAATLRARPLDASSPSRCRSRGRGIITAAILELRAHGGRVRRGADDRRQHPRARRASSPRRSTATSKRSSTRRRTGSRVACWCSRFVGAARAWTLAGRPQPRRADAMSGSRIRADPALRAATSRSTFAAPARARHHRRVRPLGLGQDDAAALRRGTRARARRGRSRRRRRSVAGRHGAGSCAWQRRWAMFSRRRRLFDHLDVRGNLEFARKRVGRPRLRTIEHADRAARHRRPARPRADHAVGRRAAACRDRPRPRERAAPAAARRAARRRSTLRAAARSCPGSDACATNCDADAVRHAIRSTKSRGWPTRSCCWIDGPCRCHRARCARSACAHRPAAMFGEDAGALLQGTVARAR